MEPYLYKRLNHFQFALNCVSLTIETRSEEIIKFNKTVGKIQTRDHRTSVIHVSYVNYYFSVIGNMLCVLSFNMPYNERIQMHNKL